jgi:tRNA (guanine-N7-)-methyltransferase
MARRALRKIDPSLDLTQHLKTWDDLPKPWDAQPLFRRVAPLEVEVGSGKGLFLESAAIASPDRNFVGIEIAAKYSRFAAARLAKRQLANAVLVHGDAQRVFKELLPDNCLAAVHIYFPDPWWKKRHHKRRVVNEQFLGHAVRTLAPGGRLHYWTDVRERFEEVLELIATKPELIGPLEVLQRPAQHDLDYRTHFERRMRLNDLPVYRAEFRHR